MAFVKKIWKDRISQFPNRRTINDGYVTKQVTVGRDEGAVTEEGTPFDATEMNDLENRIYAAIEEGGGGGGSAGTYNYTELFNKPRINNHELNGNQSAEDLGLVDNSNYNAAELPIESGSATNTKDYIDSGLSGKADKSSAVQIATYSFSKSVTTNTESTFFVTRTDFNLPAGAKVKDGYIRQNHNSNTYSYWAYALQVSESGTNAMQGAIYNPTASNRNYPVMAVVFYTM